LTYQILRRHRGGEDVFIVLFIRELCHGGVGVQFYFGWDRIGLADSTDGVGRSSIFQEKTPDVVTRQALLSFYWVYGFWFWVWVWVWVWVLGMVLGYGGEVTE
jgi:hypothetical protein